MNLGEKIYQLRTGKNMSQGDLADALEVSRQSVSKWETNGSVPELDKLIKMSEIFQVSLDELVLDRKQQLNQEEPKVVYVEKRETGSPKKTMGVILLCFAGLFWIMVALYGDIVSGLVLASPFVASGLVCLLVRRHAGLWCCWIVYLFIELYMRFATGLNWQFVLLPYAYNGEWNLHMIVAWILFGTFITMTMVTAFRLRSLLPGTVRTVAAGTAGAFGIYFLTWVVFAAPVNDSDPEFIYSMARRFVTSVTGWVRNIVLAVAVILLVRLITMLWENRKRK